MSAPAASGGDPDLAVVGRLLADPGRCRMLLALDDGRALPASRLAAEAGVAPSTASGHLRLLTDAGMLAVETHGRHRYYRLADASVGRLIEVVGAVAPATPIRSLREQTRAHALRRSRTCYDHLAGRLGVDLMAAFLSLGWIGGGDGSYVDGEPRAGAGREVDYRVTPEGTSAVERFGVVLPPEGTRVRYCVDWTEQRHHLAGALGRGLLRSLVDREWIRRSTGHRAVELTAFGRQGLEAWLSPLGVLAQPE